MPPTPSSLPTATTTLLRKITIYVFLPAFPLLLAHGIASGKAFPALGLLPLAGSALLAALLLYRDRVAAIGSPIQSLSATNVFFADAVLTAMMLAMLIGSWISLTRTWRETSQVILGTYGTVFMMVDCGIHVYLLSLNALHMFTARACDCPHCRSVSKRSGFLHSVSEYTPLSEGDVEEEAYRDVEAGDERTGL